MNFIRTPDDDLINPANIKKIYQDSKTHSEDCAEFFIKAKLFDDDDDAILYYDKTRYADQIQDAEKRCKVEFDKLAAGLGCIALVTEFED